MATFEKVQTEWAGQTQNFRVNDLVSQGEALVVMQVGDFPNVTAIVKPAIARELAEALIRAADRATPPTVRMMTSEDLGIPDYGRPIGHMVISGDLRTIKSWEMETA